MASWHVIRSKPRKEILLQQQLLAHGVEVFFPQINVNPVNPRAAKTQPYFPGYMFVHVDVERVGFSLLNWMPYSLGMVCFGRNIPRVPEELIRATEACFGFQDGGARSGLPPWSPVLALASHLRPPRFVNNSGAYDFCPPFH